MEKRIGVVDVCCDEHVSRAEHITAIVARLEMEKSPLVIVCDKQVIYNGSGKEISQEKIDEAYILDRGIHITREPNTYMIERIPPIEMYESPVNRKDTNQPWKKRGKNSKGFNNFHK